MKKHLIAAAVAAAVAVPAMAQNVTISGRIDTAIGSVDANNGTSATKMNSSTLTTNQIVISGSEDLGGGLKATFNILSPMNSDTNSTAFNFGGRGMLVGLTGSFGSIDLGRSSGTHANASVVTSGILGNASPLNLRGAGFQARPDNSISYTSPTMSGLSVRVLHGLGAETDPNTGSQTEISVRYAAGPLTASVGFGQHDKIAAGVDGDADETSAIVTYNMGFATVNARYLALKYDQAATEATKGEKGWGLGVAVPLGNGLTGAIEYTDINNKANSDRTRITAGLIKDLSKRTNVYLAAYKDSEKNATLEDGSAYLVGIRHNF